VTLLDAYALIAFLVGGPAAPTVRALLREGDAAVTSTNLAETLDVSQRIYGLEIQRSMELLDPLLQGSLTAIPLDVRLAVSAAEMRASHYHRTSRPISLADAVLLASAKTGDRIATADPDVLAIADIEKLATVELPEQG
jgi:PIN domain nuclease of toxin-antitoxin system